MAVAAAVKVVAFVEDYQPAAVEELRLLEVGDEELLRELLAEGASIKGPLTAARQTRDPHSHPQPHQQQPQAHQQLPPPAVLCTRSRTYALRAQETSNALLLCAPPPPPPNDDDAEMLDTHDNNNNMLRVVGVKGSYWELAETAPKTDELERLLAESVYTEADDNEEGEDERMAYGDPRRMYTFNELLERVQASDHELRLALSSLHALPLPPHTRLVHPSVSSHVLRLLLLSATELGLPLSSPLTVSRLAPAMTGVRKELVEHGLRMFGRERWEGVGEGGEGWVVDGEKVCAFYGVGILQKTTRWKLEDFMAAWKEAVPEVSDSRPHFPQHTLHQTQQAQHSTAQHTTPCLLGFMFLCGRLLHNANSDTHAVRASRIMHATHTHTRTRTRTRVYAQPFSPSSLSPLRADCLLDTLGGAPYVSLFRERDLPDDPDARFRALFERRARWTAEEIEPFVRRLRAPGQSIESLLLRHARLTQGTGGDAFYSAR
eukprot:jgi/Chlat1/471/Chrsp103S01072